MSVSARHAYSMSTRGGKASGSSSTVPSVQSASSEGNDARRGDSWERRQVRLREHLGSSLVDDGIECAAIHVDRLGRLPQLHDPSGEERERTVGEGSDGRKVVCDQHNRLACGTKLVEGRKALLLKLRVAD